MTKGYGSIFEEQPQNLSPDEIIVLTEIMKNPLFIDKKSSSDIAHALNWTVRKTDQSISRLHGMDLIKGGKKSNCFTEDELELKYDAKNPQYWIGNIGQKIYYRAKHALDNSGSISAFFKETNDFDFDEPCLYPKDGRRKTSMLASVYNFASVDISLHHDTMTPLQQEVILVLKNDSKIKMTLETIDE